MLDKNIRNMWEGTAYRVAKETGIKESTARDFLKGRTEYKTISVDNAIKLAKSVGMSVEELYSKIYGNDQQVILFKENKKVVYMRDNACYNCKCKKEMAIQAKGGK